MKWVPPPSEFTYSCRLHFIKLFKILDIFWFLFSNFSDSVLVKRLYDGEKCGALRIPLKEKPFFRLTSENQVWSFAWYQACMVFRWYIIPMPAQIRLLNFCFTSKKYYWFRWMFDICVKYCTNCLLEMIQNDKNLAFSKTSLYSWIENKNCFIVLILEGIHAQTSKCVFVAQTTSGLESLC